MYEDGQVAIVILKGDLWLQANYTVSLRFHSEKLIGCINAFNWRQSLGLLHNHTRLFLQRQWLVCFRERFLYFPTN